MFLLRLTSLPDDLHDALRREATAERRPATELVREALTGWVAARQRARVAEDIRRFALAHGGSELDLALEQAGVDHLVVGVSP